MGSIILAETASVIHQILNEQGILVTELPEIFKNKETLLTLYKNMLLGRLFDKKAISLQRTGKLGTYAPINGQEAISSAIGHAMQKEDILIPYYRDYSAQFQRGVKISEILAYWGGDERGSDFQSQKEDLPICVPIASQCLHAAGVAFSFNYRKTPRVAVTCLGDGGTSEGDFYEAMNVAGVWNLPLVFVINNNQWAISVPRNQQTLTKTLAEKSKAAGFSGIQVDGNDVLACRYHIGEAIEKARRGEGPTLIEAVTYRLCHHTTADDSTRYQPEIEVNAAEGKEPFLRIRKYLETAHGFHQKDEEEITASLNQLIQDEAQIYLSRSPQPIESIFDYHFETLPDYLIDQRQIAIEEACHA